MRQSLLPKVPYLIIMSTILWSYAGGLGIHLSGSGLFTIAYGLQDTHTFVGQTVYWRPLTNYIFQSLYAGFGLNPLPYHLLDLIIHSLNTLLVYHIASRLSRDGVIALAAGVMFAAFYRHASLLFSGGFFYEHGYALFCLVAIATFLHYQDTNKAAYLAFALFSILIALLIKESAIVAFPVIAVLDQLYRPPSLPSPVPVRYVARIRWGLIFCLVIIGIIYVACRMHFMPHSGGGMPGWLNPIKTLGAGKMFGQIYKGFYLTISNVCPGKDMSGVFYLGFMVFVWKATMYRRLAITTGTLLIISVLPLFFTHGLASRYVYLSTAFSVMLLAIVIRYSARSLAERILPSYSDVGVGLVTGVILLLIVSFNVHKIHRRAVLHTEAGKLLWSNLEDIVTTFPNGTKGFRLYLVNNPMTLPRSTEGIEVWEHIININQILRLFYKEPDSAGEVGELVVDLGYPIFKHRQRITSEELDCISQDPKNRIMVFNPYTRHLVDMTGKTSQAIRVAIGRSSTGGQ